MVHLLICCLVELSILDKKDKNFLPVNTIIEAYKKFKQFAQKYYPDVEIISINPVGLKGLFKDEVM